MNDTKTAILTNDFESLLETSFEQESALEEGNIIKGTVVKVSKDFVIVDIGYKSEGEIPIGQFTAPDGKVNVDIGQKVDVYLNELENEHGLVELSKEKADKMRVWDDISDACDQESIIEGTISQRVKGGLSVTIAGGVKAFLPGSQVDLRPIRNLEKLIGETHRFKIIKFNKKRGNIVLSRRALLEQERNEMKSQTLENLQEGATIEGIVKNITEYGAFVDLGGIDGLLHITDMSWGRIGHPSEILKVGDKIDVRVLKYNEDNERVSLGLKQTQPDPWEDAVSRYPIGLKVNGKVVSVTDYGAFVELEQGIEGLIHVSEMSWTKRVKHPSKVLEVGDEVECVILDVDTTAQRISLGLKQLEPHPWERFIEQYTPGNTIKGKIRSITDYGVFIGIDDNIDGMVHKSDLSWTQRINHPSELFRKGEEVEAVILNIDHEEEKVSLGIKQLYEDPWERIPMDYPLGQVREVKVIKITDFGAFVELEPGIEGLIHVSELSNERIDDPKSIIQEGESIKAEIITLDPQERKIGLSIKSLTGNEEEGDMTEYAKKMAKKPTEKATLGDLLSSQIGQMAEKADDASEKKEDAE
ncbi:MAG: 30S ribosomal protein S1 [Deltaproteobacteria bacterium]|nr:30S ribosomal protein S1 [Deltaproteobacteria bacterium]MBN2671661.1 30S ribosomal protein S1 [Deltaproteobacteria bacterium]